MSFLLLKRQKFALAVAGLCALIAACDQEHSLTGNALVEFMFGMPGEKTPEATLMHWKNLQDATALIVSIEDAFGSVVYDSERVELYRFDDDYLSHPLSLLPGSYALTEFLVIDETGDVLYAAPLEGTDMAYLVADPLEIAFDISKDDVTTVRPEVLSTEEHTPEDFGYTSFGLDIVEVLDFLVAVFVFDEATQELTLTTATIEITGEDDTVLYTGILDVLTNKISVQDGHAQYQITITKPGYMSYVGAFTAAELASYFASTENGPLEVVLQTTNYMTSCKAIFDSGESTGDGIYTIDPDGTGGELDPVPVYCDMTGGGWTLVYRATNAGRVAENGQIQGPGPLGETPITPSSVGHHKLHDDAINRLRSGAVANDLRVVISYNNALLGTSWHRSDCTLQSDVMAPASHVCNASTTSGPNATDYTASQHGAALARWYVDSSFGYIWPDTHIGPVPGGTNHGGNVPNPYCTWYDSRTCPDSGAFEIWAY